MRGKVVVAQGGGPTAVINESLVGVVLEARKFAQVTHIYGAINGLEGIADENFVDLSQETTLNLEQVALSPSSALFSTRIKPDAQYCKKIFKVLKAHNVRYFFYIGGNDSSDTVRILKEQAKEDDYDFRAIHIPKTIDNDLVKNDHTPGFASASKFVAQAFMGADLDNRSLPGVYIGVVMGRHAGWLTGSACLAQKYPSDGPHLIYLPERAFDPQKFIKDVQGVYKKYSRCVVAVSEGIADENGVQIITKLKGNSEKDDHGNVQLSGTGALGDLLSDYIKKHTTIDRVRSDTFGYLQRSFFGCVSDTDQNEAREIAQRAVQYAIWHKKDGSMSIQRVGNYCVDYTLLDIQEVAGKTRTVPSKYINSLANGMTQGFKDYLRPLLGSDFRYPSRLRAPKVTKIL